MTREEALQWAKDRALAELDAGAHRADGPTRAMMSFISDTSKTDDQGKPTIEWTAPAMVTLTQVGMLYANPPRHDDMRRWIEGFN